MARTRTRVVAVVIAAYAARAKADMDAGHAPGEDTGSKDYETYPSEWYAELFAFMSLVEPDQAVRDDYGRRARALIMHVIGRAAARVGADDEPSATRGSRPSTVLGGTARRSGSPSTGP